jgi:hypothetical protein
VSIESNTFLRSVSLDIDDPKEPASARTPAVGCRRARLAAGGTARKPASTAKRFRKAGCEARGAAAEIGLEPLDFAHHLRDTCRKARCFQTPMPASSRRTTFLLGCGRQGIGDDGRKWQQSEPAVTRNDSANRLFSDDGRKWQQSEPAVTRNDSANRLFSPWVGRSLV